jgi:hypothetical protein
MRFPVVSITKNNSLSTVKNIFTVLVESNIWVSTGLSLLVLPGAHMMSVPYDWRITILGFFVSMIVYTWDHRLDVIRGEKTTTTWFTQYYYGRRSLVTIIVSLIGAAIIMALSPLTVTIGSFLIIATGLIYSGSFPSTKATKKYSIKNKRFLKAWFTPFIIALAVVVAPLLYNVAFTTVNVKDVCFTFLYFFIMIACNANCFDIRDLESDHQHAVKTLPAAINAQRTLSLLHLLNLIIAITMLYAWYTHVFTPHPEMLLWVIGNAFYLSKITLQTPPLFFDIAVDGTLYIPTLSLLFVHFFHVT